MQRPARIPVVLMAALAFTVLPAVATPAAPLQENAGADTAMTASAEATARVLSARDTLRINSVGSPRLSQDGEWVLYTVAVRDMDDDEIPRHTQIWRVRTSGESRRQMTRGKAGGRNPAWHPTGDRFAFISSRDGGKPQVFFMYTDGGEAWQVTDHDEGVSSFRISGDGERIAFVAQDPLGEEKEKQQKQKDDTEVVDAEFRMSHLWLHDVETGKSRRLTSGDFTVSDPQWSPDSVAVAFVTRANTKVDDSWNSDVWVVDATDEAAEPRKLYENAGPDSSPRWSPDGATIAFTANPHAFTSVWYSKLYLIPADGGTPRILLEEFDRNVSSPIWSHNGGTIWWSTGDRTTANLFSVEVETGAVSKHEPPVGANSQFEVAASGDRWVWVHSDGSWPGEVWTAGADLSSPVRISDANAWMRKEDMAIADVEVVSWQNSDGQTIEGILTWPVDREPGEKYPLAVNPHGGPSGVRMTSWSATNQLLAGNGFLVLEPNFRGSSNYGQEFLNANRNNWGVRDYDDIMTGVDHVIDQGWADPDRMVAYGWSYGGYMTFWMSTQTDRFKLISPGAGLSNLYSMYSTTDIPGYLGWFFGTPWDHEDVYLRLSPIRHVKNVTSKILIMHGGNDARVPPEQAVEFYRALRDLGKDVTFVRFPCEGHGIGEPRHAMDRLRRYVYAFSEAVGIEPISELEWEKEREKAEKEGSDAEAGPDGESEVTVVGSAPSVPDRGAVDRGIFEVIEPGRWP